MKGLAEINGDIFDSEIPKFIGRQNERGQVLAGEKLFEYIGLTDKRGNYFYVRIIGEDKFAKRSDKIDPYSIAYTVSTPLRIVFVVRDINIELFQYKMLNDIMGLNLVSFDRKRRPIIELDVATTDIEDIYSLETGKQLQQWSGAVGLLAIDFTLKYQLDYINCLALPSLCSNINYCDFEQIKDECANLDEVLQRLQNLTNNQS